MRLVAALPLIAGVVLAACTSPRPEAEDVVAIFDGGSVTAADLDRALLELPAAELRMQTFASVGELEQLVRQLVVQRLLVAEAHELAPDQDPEFVEIDKQLRREVAVGLYLEAHPLAPEPPAEAELRAYYDEHVEARRRHARRMVYHLFKRFRPGASRDEVRAEVAALRRRVVSGEPFSALAAAHSDSELRHVDGMLGLVERGQLGPELDAIVFSLEENVPSEPITTRDGVHLFLVRLAVEAKEFTFEEVRGQATQAIRARKHEELMARLVAEVPIDVDVYAAGDEDLPALLAGDDPEALVLRVGEYALKVAGFRTLLVRAARLLGGGGAGLPAAYLRSLKQRELIYQQLVRDQRLDTAEVGRRLARHRDQELAEWALGKRLARFPEDRPERLRAHYEANKMRFTTPLELRIRRLLVPLGGDPVALMARLEVARAALDAGTVDLDALADELGGRVGDLGWKTLAELQRIEPKAVLFAGQLVAGRHCAPYRSAAGLEVLEVIGRRDPAVQPFAAVRDLVREDLLRNHGQQLVAELAEELVAEAHLTIDRDRLQELLETGFGAIDDCNRGELALDRVNEHTGMMNEVTS